MSDDPKRWREGGGDGALERELLASVHDVRPPAQAKEQAWQAISVQLAAGAAAAGVAGTSLAAKAMWTLAALGVAAGGYVAARELAKERPPEARERGVETVKLKVAKPAPVATVPEEPSQAAETEPAPAPQRPIDVKHRDPLSAESSALTRARAALRAGDLAAAERLLQRMASEFEGGALAQEREVLAIEVLAARGDAAGARARVRAFEQAYPDSPHAARLRTLLGAP